MSNRNEGKPGEPPKDQGAHPLPLLLTEKEGGLKPPLPSRYIQTTEEDKASAFEKCAVLICWIFVVLFFPLSLFCCILVVPEYIRLIILRLGRLRKGAKGPGLVFFLPCIDGVQAVDIRTDVYKVIPQEVLTKDSVTITVTAVIYYCIYDAIDSIIQVDNVNEATLMIAKVTLRNIVGSKTLNVLLTSRQALSREIQEAVAGITARWGVHMERVDIMDISLPANLKVSLASVAEAVREARAKIILAEGEAKASKALKEASDVMSQNQIALQLRHLQILSSLATEKRVNVIFPIPLEIMEPFFNEGELSKSDPDDQKDESESDFSGYFTPKVYIEENRKDDDADNSKPTTSWGLPTFLRRKQGSEDARPSPRSRSQQAPGNRPNRPAESEPYPLFSSPSDSPRSPRSTRKVSPSPPDPTIPPIPNPPPRPPPRSESSSSSESQKKGGLMPDQYYLFGP
ncbi:band 7 protein AGAP004871-like isoform X2 [Drosophila kikkawai]|uniref:Band 7 protein AGAP004871-like isoform X2 n=1 Tax=Drosophila kikkawai TaxID=30033 RepID=A0A6P4JA74_DROKI|nr:band 7 protein AGAP004871-like isoform X2 [Drosophila kikkawai]